MAPETGKPASIVEDGASVPSAELDGEFRPLAGTLAAIYRDEGTLWFQLGDRWPVDDHLDVRLKRVGALHHLTVSRDGRPVVRRMYFESYLWRRKIPRIVDDTPFVEREHCDLGLLLYNVVNEPGRAARMFAAPGADTRVSRKGGASPGRDPVCLKQSDRCPGR